MSLSVDAQLKGGLIDAEAGQGQEAVAPAFAAAGEAAGEKTHDGVGGEFRAGAHADAAAAMLVCEELQMALHGAVEELRVRKAHRPVERIR
jgi:hypothetical protein